MSSLKKENDSHRREGGGLLEADGGERGFHTQWRKDRWRVI